MTRFSGANPAEQSFEEWQRESKRKRFAYWSAIRRMREDYIAEVGDNAGLIHPLIHIWAEDRYGIRMGMDGAGQFTEEYTISDAKKFMLFQIKYWC